MDARRNSPRGFLRRIEQGVRRQQAGQNGHSEERNVYVVGWIPPHSTQVQPPSTLPRESPED